MTNYEYIKGLPIEEFAKLLIINDTSMNDAPITIHISPNGERFMSYDDAIDETIEWLKSERGGFGYLEFYLGLKNFNLR